MKFKHLLSIILAFVISFGVCSVALADETAEIPEGYTPIYTAEDLNNIRNNLSGKYVLMNDIDLSVYENWEPIGTDDNPFNGEMDGNGFLIKNLRIEKNISESKNYVGLFGVAVNSSFKNIIVENGNIILSEDESVDPSYVNIIAGMIVAKTLGYDFTKVVRCSATGKIDVTGGSVVLVGGLVGVGIMDNCILSSSNYVDIKINTKNYNQKIYIGGLLGGSSENKESYSESYFRIEKSANFGDIQLNNSICFEETEIVAGGIAGFQVDCNELSECYNRGEISSSDPWGKMIIGGILGEARRRLEKSYNTGKIAIKSDENDKVSAICSIKKPFFMIPEEPAMSQDFIVYNCYYSNSNIVPCTQNQDEISVYYKNVFLLSEEEFKIQESFISFDFENVWEMEEGGYPVLISQPEIILKNTLELMKGEVYSLVVGKSVRTTNDLVATINNDGKVIAIETGTAVINVEYDYKYKAEYFIKVTEQDVIEPTYPDEPVITKCCFFRLLSCLLSYICKFLTSLSSILFSVL